MRRISQLFLFVCIVFSLQAQNVTFSGKVFLQGAYDPNTSLMRTALLQQGSLPLLQPYNLAPWYHNGTEALISTQAGMVDWILVDLRTSPDTAIARKAAILYTDGTIRDATGDSILHFNVPSGLYYLAIMHRSHLSTMTATKHAFQNGAILDFVDTTLQVYGTCMIGLGSEKRGMIGGDVNQDRVLKYSGSGNDRSPILQRILSEVGGTAINATTSGYFKEDLRMDGTVKYSGSGNDPSLIIQNLTTLTGSTAINSTFTGSVPHAVYVPYSCYPQPDQAHAGPDSLNIPGTSITLQANQAVNGVGVWSVLTGTGGSFADFSLHNTLFTGQYGTIYTLVWTISNHCGSNSDTVNVSFICLPLPDPAFAGPDSLNIPGTSIVLKAKQVVNGTGHWSILSGMGGSFADSSLHNTLFTGQYGTIYTLVWTISNHCGSNSDTVNVSFICLPLPDQANAGPDSLNIPSSSIALQANQVVNGSGLWTIISGQGGSFADNTSATTLFSGLAGEVYSLVWTISNICGSSSDTVRIGFICLQPDPANAGPYSTPCQYTIELLDDYGDGWNGGALSVMVNGVTVLQNITLNSGYGPAFFSFTVNTGDVITTTYSPGSWSYENYYHVKNATGVIVFSSGLSGAVPQGGQVAAACPGSFYPNVTGDSIQLEGNVPVNGQGSWSIIAGTGGSFSDSASATSIFYGQSSEVYTLVWTISNACGSSSDTVNITFLCFPQPTQAHAGQDTLSISGTTYQLQANQPVNGTGLWTILSGTGGSLANGSLHNTSFTGQVGNAYSLIWTISNPCGSTYDTVNIGFAASQTFTCGATLTDTRDGQQYPTVQIGTQCWMAKNLNIGTMVSGSSNQTNNSTIEKYCYNNDANNCATYGGLYQWDEMMSYTTTPGTQGICPTGWHIPTDAEWCTLTTYLDATVNCNTWNWSGTNAGGKMKATGTTHWLSPNTGATNSSGFTALGAGYRFDYGYFYLLRTNARFWSSSEYSSTYGIYRPLTYDLANVGRYNLNKTYGFSVRCLRNN